MAKESLLRAPQPEDVRLDGLLWSHYGREKVQTILKHLHTGFENTLEPTCRTSGAIHNLRLLAGRITGEPYGIVWQDSDLFKWYEGLCIYYGQTKDEQWRPVLDEIAELLVDAQAEDGYYNTFFQLGGDGWKPLQNLWQCHELYSMGHIIEACLAHHHATGEERLLTVAKKMADLLDRTFGPAEQGKIPGYCGHQEIELALIRLYRVTGVERYLQLARFFILERGAEPFFFDVEWETRGQLDFWTHEKREKPGREINIQTHLPLREQRTAEGHAVRAAYMYEAMADIAYETDDAELTDQLHALWDNIVQRRMYITGGIGSLADGERFGADYELPNDCHCETCAGIGMVGFAQRMFHAEHDGKYIDVLERVLYNNLLAAANFEGNKYFYVNVLERQMKHWKLFHSPERQAWFGCACCPTNIARFYPSIGTYVYSQDDTNLYINLFAQGTAQFMLGGKKVQIAQTTDYPWDGKVRIEVAPETPIDCILHIRIPGWSSKMRVWLNGVEQTGSSEKGYLAIQKQWVCGDTITLDIPMIAELVRPHPYIDALRGKLAAVRGPLVYCLEEQDNGPELSLLSVRLDAHLDEHMETDFLYGGIMLYAEGKRLNAESFGDALYRCTSYSYDTAQLRFIPYFMWDNRGAKDMTVWVRQEQPD